MSSVIAAYHEEIPWPELMIDPQNPTVIYQENRENNDIFNVNEAIFNPGKQLRKSDWIRLHSVQLEYGLGSEINSMDNLHTNVQNTDIIFTSIQKPYRKQHL